MLEHGGRLRQAARRHGIPLAEWVDLSTGINPHAYPVPLLAPEVWQRLPETDDGLEAAAAAYYGSPHLLPVAGSQAAIQALPACFAPGRVLTLAPTYAEHPHAWRGHQLPADPQGLLTQILLYHAVAGEALSTDLSNGQTITTLNGKDITVTINADGVFINNAKVTFADVLADNGVVHVIDAVLLPPSATNESNDKDRIAVYPNPSTRGLTIESANGGSVSAKLIDLYGRMVESGSGEKTIFLNFDQAPGTYFLEVNDGSRNISIHRVVKL